jgi:mannose-6-phosphate isomerase
LRLYASKRFIVDRFRIRGSRMKLEARFIEKPWGLQKLPPMFARAGEERIGEVWFVGGHELPLLPKYLFTSEKLSVQVHPDDEQAKMRGHLRGKSECWYILGAEAGAQVGLGLTREIGPDDLRAAALNGSISEFIDWRPVDAGDFFYVEPGTIHAIGCGISLLEFQQNSDLTYRLYDYGRPRELHVDDAIAVANRGPYREDLWKHVDPAEEIVLVDGPHFTLVQARSDQLRNRRRWVLPLEAKVRAGAAVAGPGECLLLDPDDALECEGGRMLIGAAS